MMLPYEKERNSMLTVDVIIPNWNGKELLEKNIPAILCALNACPCGTKHIIVIDDASTDKSVTFLKEQHPEVILIVNEINIGFHKSVNKAFHKSTADVVILLNSDMKPNKDAFIPLI